MNAILLEERLYPLVEKVKTFNEFTCPLHPEVYFIKDIKHAIVAFPNGSIFNCNPRDYPLPIQNKMVDGLINEQVEPSEEEYEIYWFDATKVNPLIENDQNCILWSAYYLDWYLKRQTDIFPASLYDLENWIKTFN